MISIKFFQHNELEVGVESIIGNTAINFIYIPSNDDVKFFNTEFGDEFETLNDMLTTYAIQPNLIEQFINEFDHIDVM